MVSHPLARNPATVALEAAAEDDTLTARWGGAAFPDAPETPKVTDEERFTLACRLRDARGEVPCRRLYDDEVEALVDEVLAAGGVWAESLREIQGTYEARKAAALARYADLAVHEDLLLDRDTKLAALGLVLERYQAGESL